MTRVFVGTFDIAGTVTNIAASLRAVGYEVETGVWRKHEPYFSHFEYDHDLKWLSEELKYRQVRNGMVQPELSDKAIEFILGFDVYVFCAAHSFLLGNLDYPILHSKKKTIVSYLCGSEVRHWSAAQPMWEAWGTPLPSYIQAQTPAAHCENLVEVIRHGIYHGTLANRLHNLRMAERYSTAIFSTHDQSGLGVRPFHHFRVPMDIAACEFRIPGRQIPVVLHAPTNRAFKRSDLILGALQQLQEEGVAFELRLLEGIPHSEILKALTDADVLIDEMSLYPATLSHEAMASGCAVLSGNKIEANPLPARRPVVHIEPSNLVDQLRRVLTDGNLRVELAKAGRRYVEATNSPEAIGRFIENAIREGRAGIADYYPKFFFTDFTNVTGERVPDYIRQMTMGAILTHGAPADTNVEQLVAAGMLPPNALSVINHVPRWPSTLRETASWVLCGRDIEPIAAPEA